MRGSWGWEIRWCVCVGHVDIYRFSGSFRMKKLDTSGNFLLPPNPRRPSSQLPYSPFSPTLPPFPPPFPQNLPHLPFHSSTLSPTFLCPTNALSYLNFHHTPPTFSQIHSAIPSLIQFFSLPLIFILPSHLSNHSTSYYFFLSLFPLILGFIIFYPRRDSLSFTNYLTFDYFY